MKKYVINLEKRPDRKAHFLQHNQDLKDVEFVTALDGYQVDHDYLKKNGYAVDQVWRDPFKDRRVTKGEVGCFISHYRLYEKIAQQNKPVMILEDDAMMWPIYDEDKVEELMGHCDFLYMAYNENEPTWQKRSNVEGTHIPGYPYNSHAYVITPNGAKEIMRIWGKNIIPVDEVHAQLTINSKLKVLALDDFMFRSAYRADLGTDIEPTNDFDWFIDFKVHPITIGTDVEKSEKLVDSANKQGITVNNIGANVEWGGSDMTGPGGGHKIVMIQEYLAKLPANDVVLFTDAYDVFYQFDLDTITRRYMDMNNEIIFAAERECWPDNGMASWHPTSHTDYRYLNSGCFIGRVGSLMELFAEAIEQDDDDQLYIQRRWLQNQENHSVRLDVEGYIFQCHETEMIISDGMLYNPATFCYPAVYHGNGGSQAKSTFNDYYNQLYKPKPKVHIGPMRSPLYVPHYGKADILEKDMLLIDFMTPDQCEQLIEIANKHGGYEPLPGDKFPAYEIRMKELGLWDDLKKHWEDVVYPIVEEYWWPMQMYGLRDAFVMRYSVDTQRSLPMHNDASLVTGSVKLNDNYEGASLVFPRQNINNDDIPIGKCILFPGMVTHGHECTELKSGVKYSFTMWSSRYVGDEN